MPNAESPDELLLAQFRECWADNRNYDVIVWQIPAAIGAIAGIMLNALRLSAGGDDRFRPLVAAGAAWVTFPLVVALVKNRIFQIERNNWRIKLFEALTNNQTTIDALDAAAPEQRPATGNLVLFSTPHIASTFDQGPWYWRVAASTFKGIRAYNILLLASLVVLIAEVALTVGLTIELFVG